MDVKRWHLDTWRIWTVDWAKQAVLWERGIGYGASQLSNLSRSREGDFPADTPEAPTAHGEVLLLEELNRVKSCHCKVGRGAPLPQDIKYTSLPCWALQGLSAEEQSLLYWNCPCFGRSIVTFSKPEVAGIKQAQWEGRNQKPYLPSPTSKSSKGKVLNLPSFLLQLCQLFSAIWKQNKLLWSIWGRSFFFFFKVQKHKKELYPEENILKLLLLVGWFFKAEALL